MELIEQLKNEHIQIIDLFDEIEAAQETVVQKEKLKNLKDLTMSHVKLEEEQLYPVLCKSHYEEVRKMCGIFYDIMTQYSSDLIKSLDALLALPSLKEKEPWTAYFRMRNRMKDRIAIEETALFPAYKVTQIGTR